MSDRVVFLLLLSVLLFLYCLRYGAFRGFVLRCLVLPLTILLLAGGCLLAIDTFLFYYRGDTISSCTKLFIHFFWMPPDAYRPIARFRIIEGQTNYSETVIHKYAGSYCLWIVTAEKAENPAKSDPVIRFSIELKDSKSGRLFYSSSTNETGWSMFNGVFTQCLWYDVPTKVPLRQEVTLDIGISDTIQLLREFPHAVAEVRYDYHE